jgi:hypothetical protein
VSFTAWRERQNAAVDAARRAESLLQLPVRVRGIQLGRAIDLVLDLDGRRAIGVEVACGDGIRRYLPLAAARVGEDEIVVGSSLLLLSEADLAFYRERARTLSSLRGSSVGGAGGPLGVVVDVLIGARDALVGLLVDDGERERRVPLDKTVSIALDGNASAA